MRRLVLVPALVLPGLLLGACAGGNGHQELGDACKVVRKMAAVTSDPGAYQSLLQQAQKDAESAVHLNPDLDTARNLLDVLDSGGVTPASQVATATRMCAKQ